MARFTAEEKIKMVLRYLGGNESYQEIGRDLKVSKVVMRGWVRLYEHQGAEAFCQPYTTYTQQFKLDVLSYMNEMGTSSLETAAIFNISSAGLIRKWRRAFEIGGIDALKPKKKGRPSMKKETKSNDKKTSPVEGSMEALRAENERLRMENAYFKKVERFSSGKGKITNKIKAQVIFELKAEFDVVELVKVADIPRSTYYYWEKRLQREDKYAKEKEAIEAIYHEHKGRYGYRRIAKELKKINIFHDPKTINRLMNEMGLKCEVRIKKYRSYRGKVGKIAPNLLNRDFHAGKINEKWVTDVTEFHLFGEKRYLSPVLDLCNGEIIAYKIMNRPVYQLVGDMLDEAIGNLNPGNEVILHSDQGWHYQMKKYQKTLEKHNIKQSMSRKGNCLDNAVIENFFGLLKSELLYLQEFESMEHFERELHEYIEYYNHKRMKAKLKDLSPVEYRTQVLEAA
ncbi:IS3 family transposase [Bacillus sp. FJAT-22090]|uniref:IS3 family transposase n=1 Tax=Bacillus sp. FJAT-22090 TaxID=1581038 RepID=UPI0012E12917|nr:IS3 family transposase [Bacillus sp. FJAT-22090]